MTDSSGAIASGARYNYDAYGVSLGSQPSTLSPSLTSLLYTGEQFDAGLQQYYLRARYYNQSSGRFTQIDSLAGSNLDPESLHRHAYGNCDPVNLIDPSGTSAVASAAGLPNLINLLVTAALIVVFAGFLLASVRSTLDHIELSRDISEGLSQLMSAALEEARVDFLFAVIALFSAFGELLNAVREALRKAAQATGRTLRMLLKLPKYLIIKSLGPSIFAFDVQCLALNPQWFVLYYDANRTAATQRRNQLKAANLAYWNATPFGFSVDEFPYASTIQGGPPNAQSSTCASAGELGARGYTWRILPMEQTQGHAR